jgi:hypothetical protein
VPISLSYTTPQIGVIHLHFPLVLPVVSMRRALLQVHLVRPAAQVQRGDGCARAARVGAARCERERKRERERERENKPRGRGARLQQPSNFPPDL